MSKVFPVIHFLNRDLALEQAAIAHAAGADGVFLISHHGDDDELAEVAVEVKALHSGMAVGLNLLSKSPLVAAEQVIRRGLDMVWADDMGVDSGGLNNLGMSLTTMALANQQVTFFASVAFKYRPHEVDPAGAARAAQKAGFIPTTSGAATGSAPTVDKIMTMSHGTGGCLAVASGMTPDNILSYARYLSHILVSTGVSVDDYRLDPEKLKALITASREGSPMSELGVESYHEGFKTSVLKHLKGVLDAEEWAQLRALAANRSRFIHRCNQADLDASPESLVNDAIFEDAVSVQDFLVPAFRSKAVEIDQLEGRPVYYIAGQGFYLWGLDPVLGNTLTLWVTYPAYPPGW